jgi:hypothetical protein
MLYLGCCDTRTTEALARLVNRRSGMSESAGSGEHQKSPARGPILRHYLSLEAN